MTRNLILLGIVTALTLIGAWFVGGFSILRPVNRLLGVTRRLAEGDLTARSGPSYGLGEIGELAFTFDQMAESLQHREAERKRAEEHIFRQNALLNGLNRVFQEVLVCESDEEVAKACLAVAKELTGSK